MKKLFSTLLLFVILFENSMFVHAAEQIGLTENNGSEIILNYYQYINDKNIEDYISLFTSEQQNLMHKHLVEYGQQTFFNNQELKALDIKVLSDETAYAANAINFSEVKMYEDLKCIYVEQEIKENNSRAVSYVCFILAKENNVWKIERISVPNIQYILENGEQFGNTSESTFASKQEAQLQSIINGCAISHDGILLTSTSLSVPTSITVYFTKDDNINYHGANRVSLDFATYLKNTVGQEWIVAKYADYPAYLQAGVLASKMYAWYNTVNPKRNYAPYYACILDNSNDQNYWCYSASNIESQGSQYLRYLENALAYANGLALVTEDTESIFETQYRTSDGNIHSGILNQAGALALAQNGYSCLQILQEYYGSAPGIRGARVKIVAHQ